MGRLGKECTQQNDLLDAQVLQQPGDYLGETLPAQLGLIAEHDDQIVIAIGHLDCV